MTAEDLIAFESGIAASFNRSEIRAPIHLAGGNERQLIEIFATIKPEDWIAVTWRSHYHCLLKGVQPERLKADIMAGRSITLTYPEHRIISSAIVGGILPIGLGIALSIKRRGGLERVYCFLGDMGERSGIFHECAQYAVGHDLPIVFVTEDNGLSVCTKTQEVWGRSQFGSEHFRRYSYVLSFPHSGAGKRIEF